MNALPVRSTLVAIDGLVIAEQTVDLDHQRIFNELSEMAFTRPPIAMFGQTHPAPRGVATMSFGDEVYAYAGSGETLSATPIVRHLADHAADVLGIKEQPSFAVVNRYTGPGDYLGWHCDDEMPFASIATFSFGEPRRFEFEVDGGRFATVPAAGSLLSFVGERCTQVRHRVPKSTKNAGTRISVTLRFGGLR